jgi:hypothetical protein
MSQDAISAVPAAPVMSREEVLLCRQAYLRGAQDNGQHVDLATLKKLYPLPPVPREVKASSGHNLYRVVDDQLEQKSLNDSLDPSPTWIKSWVKIEHLQIPWLKTREESVRLTVPVTVLGAADIRDLQIILDLALNPTIEE